MSHLLQSVALGADRFTINGDLRAARNATMLSLLGKPRSSYSKDCQHPDNNELLRRIVTKSVGKFKVTGLDRAVDVLGLIMNDIKNEQPDVYNLMGSAGMLCCRYVRGSSSSISNHSWGTAIDLTLGGHLDERGNNAAQLGLLKIHPIFNRHGFYWGAAFPVEDAMHFEASEGLVREWATGSNVTLPSTIYERGDRGVGVSELQMMLTTITGRNIQIDGVFGGNTENLVKAYQEANNMEATGKVDQNMLNLLSNEVKGLATK